MTQSMDSATEQQLKLLAAPKSLFIATPAYGCFVCKDYLVSLMTLRLKCASLNIPTYIKFMGNESLITRARNIMVAEFMRSKCSHLIFIDADIHFDAESVISMLNADKPVMCGIYAKKTFVWDQLEKRVKEPIQQRMVEFNINIKKNGRIEQNRYIEVMDAATGFMMIKRDVFELVIERFPELTCVNDIPGVKDEIPTYNAMFDCMIDPVSRRYLSEDYAFCRRWQKIGGDIWVDLNCVLGHIGTYVYSAKNEKIVAPLI